MLSKVLIATTNKGKIKEFELMLKTLPQFENTQFLTFSDFKDFKVPAETEDDFYGNAKIKAESYFKQFKMPVIVEDSGFCVEELAGLPGVHSAEWGQGGDFANGIKRLYKMLEGKTSNAFFISVIIFKFEGGEIFAEGKCFGKTSENPKGKNGFGFDPCFIPNGESRTFGEMEIAEKSEFSHRKMAILNLIEKL